MGWLLLTFLTIPIAEIYVLFWVGGRIGILQTLVLIVATAVIGSALVARQGAAALGQVRSAFSQARFPAKELAHGAMIVVAGSLLITPGFITDGIGFALLFPPFREVMRKWFARRFSGRITMIPGPRPTEGEWNDPPPPDPLP
ncbi:MAG: FxsA family protein [Acidimicrobiia bacterium]